MTSVHASKTGIRHVSTSLRPILRHQPPCSAHLPIRNVQRRPQSTTSRLIERADPHLPRILQRSLWDTVLPQSLRNSFKSTFTPAQKKQANPATYFIWIYILIGSQAIRILQAKNEHRTFSRRADLQIEKLREVVRKLQAGEEVDVEKALGTGIPEEEEAWEEALREIESEERMWIDNRAEKKKRREERIRQREEEEARQQDASPVNDAGKTVNVVAENTGTKDDHVTVAPAGPPKAASFY